MADPEELDEDLFADLYEGDDTPAKPAQPPPAPQPEASEPVKTELVEQPPTDYAGNGVQAADSGDYGQHDGGVGGADMGGGDWNGNGNQSYDAGGMEQDDNYGPINVKEDG